MEYEDKMTRSVQRILNRLISEEVVAANLYNGSIVSVKPEQAHFISQKFAEIAADEMGDHWVALSKYATENEYDVPFKTKDINKYASRKMVSMVENLKNREDAVYYIEKAMLSEQEAIKSFQEALEDEMLPADLQGLLLRCYYEEIQHLRDLELLFRCTSIGVQAK